MRKVISLALIVMMFMCVAGEALAETADFSGYSFSELLKLREQLDQAIVAAMPMNVPEGNSYNGLTYVSNGSEIMIRNYTGSDKDVVIPDEINGVPVTIIGVKAFDNMDISSIILPKGLVSVEEAGLSLLKCKEAVVVLPETLKSVGRLGFMFMHAKCLIVQSDVEFAGAIDGCCERLYVKEGCNPVFDSSCAFNDEIKLAVLPASITRLPDGLFEKCPDVVVVAPAGSYVESYCKSRFVVCNTADYDKYVQELETLING